MRAAIRRAADRTRAVRLQFEQDNLKISAVNPDLGEAAEEVGCDFSGEGFHLGINPDYLTSFLGVVDSEQVRFDLKDENSQCIGNPVDGTDGRYLCVIMPMRV